MAKLQGYFVQHGNSFSSAAENIFSLDVDQAEILVSSTADAQQSVEQASANNNQRRPQMSRRTLTAQEIDKMVFNPQEGWDAGIIDLTRR